MELTHPYTLRYYRRRGQKFGHVIAVDSINIFKAPHRLWFWKPLYNGDHRTQELHLNFSPEVIQWQFKQHITMQINSRKTRLSSPEVIFLFAKAEHAMRFKMRFG